MSEEETTENRNASHRAMFETKLDRGHRVGNFHNYYGEMNGLVNYRTGFLVTSYSPCNNSFYDYIFR